MQPAGPLSSLNDAHRTINPRRAGLAALRRTAGHHQPSTEERTLLAEAQQCLQDAASLLPPQVRGGYESTHVWGMLVWFAVRNRM